MTDIQNNLQTTSALIPLEPGTRVLLSRNDTPRMGRARESQNSAVFHNFKVVFFLDSVFPWLL